MRPRLLDLFCGAGGASMGLFKAGFDIVGVDIKPQPYYPFPIIVGDVFNLTPEDLKEYDAFWASPPCQAFTFASKRAQRDYGYKYPDFIPSSREMLKATKKPYIIENVVGAPLLNPIRLCGTMFGLKVLRHRLFESNVLIPEPFHQQHNKDWLCGRDYFRILNGGCWVRGQEKKGSLEEWQEAMGIDWMPRIELSQAIPPTYAQFIGEWLMKAVKE